MIGIKMYIKLKYFFEKLFKDESGMGTIEVIIIIAVLVSLALVFRNFIMDMAGMVFDKIKEIIAEYERKWGFDYKKAHCQKGDFYVEELD